MIYELTMIVPENTTTQDINALTNMIGRYGRIRKTEDDGVKRLPYPISKYGRENAYGRYLFMELEMDKVTNLCEMLGTNSMVLRYLVVKSDTNFTDRR